MNVYFTEIVFFLKQDENTLTFYMLVIFPSCIVLDSLLPSSWSHFGQIFIFRFLHFFFFFFFQNTKVWLILTNRYLFVIQQETLSSTGKTTLIVGYERIKHEK